MRRSTKIMISNATTDAMKACLQVANALRADEEPDVEDLRVAAQRLGDLARRLEVERVEAAPLREVPRLRLVR